LQGGGVSCQKYYSPRQEPDCAERLANGERPDYCYVNECKDLANNPRCQRVDDLGTTNYGNEPTILNTDCVWITDPVNGAVCTTDPNKIANLTDDMRLYDVKIEKYQCESKDIRNCEDKEYKMVCPDGSSTLCQTRKKCLERETVTTTETREVNFKQTRNYQFVGCNPIEENCDIYRNRDNCINVGEAQKEAVGTFRVINGWDADGSSKNCYIHYGKCREVGPDQGSWSACQNTFGSNLLGSFDALFAPEVIEIMGYDRVGGTSDLVGCFGADNDAFDQYVDVTAKYAYTEEQFYCYQDYEDINKENCTETNDSLCLDWHVDKENSNKAACRKREQYFECTNTYQEESCVDYEEEVICQNQAISLPNVQMRNDNMTGFSESLGILGMLDDINSIWSGEYQYCSYGYFVNGYAGVYCNNCKGEGGFLCFKKKPKQRKAYEMNKKGLCHYLETDCTNEIDLGFDEICIEHTRKYCCYDSKLARVIVEQAYKQLGKSWSSGCNGLTVDDLNKLDFGAMDFSEIEAEMKSKIDARTNKIGNSLKNRIEGYYTDFTEQMDQRGAHPQDPNNQ